MFNPIGNSTLPPRNWQSSPNTRGTADVISTCLITLALCLWTALHMDIPGYGEGIWAQTLRKTKWLVVGLFAPELVVTFAVFQYRHALLVNKAVQNYTPSLDRTKADGAIDFPEWTTTHSYYVIMGGFVLEPDSAQDFLPNSRRRLTLTPRGLRYTLKHEPQLIPYLSKEEIWDKSKADGLLKFIVCVQALWYCIQCIVRMAQGLKISLMELNVWGHALCALLLYLIWWEKPLDIEQPTVLHGERVDELCALACMLSSPYGEKFCELPHGIRYGDQPLTYYERAVLPFLKDNGPHIEEGRRIGIVHSPVDDGSHFTFISSDTDTITSSSPHTRTHHCFSIEAGSWIWYHHGAANEAFKLTLGQFHPASKDALSGTTIKDQKRWTLCSRALLRHLQENYPHMDGLQSISAQEMIEYLKSSTELVVDRQDNAHLGSSSALSSDKKFLFKRMLLIFSVLSLAGLLYGGLHLLAWATVFPTRAESILWRFSGLVVVTAMPIFVLLLCLGEAAQSHGKLYEEMVSLGFVVVVLVALAYVLARVYLVFASLKQLSRLPESVYLLPNWSVYFPHIN